MGRPKLHFDLYKVYPELAVELDYSKHKTTFVYKTQMAEWVCLLGHFYKRTISDRLRGRGCPYCASRLLEDFNDLKTISPELCEEWAYAKNILKPGSVVYNSRVKVWWICKEYSHTWEDTISHRQSGRGCPYCSGHRVIDDFNSLKVKNPKLAIEWDYCKNKSRPEDYTEFSDYKAWWLCSNNHSWQASVSNRSKGRGCRVCSLTGVSRGELMVKEVLTELGYLTIGSRKLLKEYSPKNPEIDIFLPEFKVAIEYNGDYYHCEVCRPELKIVHKTKATAAEKLNLRLLVLWESEFLTNPVEYITKLVECIKNAEKDQSVFSYESHRGVCCKTVRPDVAERQKIAESGDYAAQLADVVRLRVKP